MANGTSHRTLLCHSCLIGSCSASGYHPKSKSIGRTYNNPVPGGYTAEHTNFDKQGDFWRKTASAPRQAKPIQDRVAIRVQMGTVQQGKKKISMIGVSTN